MLGAPEEKIIVFYEVGYAILHGSGVGVTKVVADSIQEAENMLHAINYPQKIEVKSIQKMSITYYI